MRNNKKNNVLRKSKNVGNNNSFFIIYTIFGAIFQDKFLNFLFFKI
jgi:hypothetical protein